MTIQFTPAVESARMLERRRRRLGMSCAQLARLSHLSLPTVNRILAGKIDRVAYGNVAAVARVLGCDMRIQPAVDPYQLQEQRAQAKAQQIVSAVQGSSGLEGQAVDDVELAGLVRQTTSELLAGPKRHLWSQ